MNRLAANRSAFSLVEVTLALGVAGFCLIAIFGLLPTGLQSNRNAIAQTSANGVLSAICADLRATPPTEPPGQATSSGQFGIAIPARSDGTSQTSTIFFSDAGRPVASATDARIRVTVTFLENETGPRSATLLNLVASWPAAVTDPAKAEGFAQTFVALDRN